MNTPKRPRLTRRVVKLEAVFVSFRLNGATFEDVVNLLTDRVTRSGPVNNLSGLPVRANRKRDTLAP